MDTWKFPSTQYRRDETATRIKTVKIKIAKIRTGCLYGGYLHYNENLNWATQYLRLGCELDTAGIVVYYR